MNTINVTILGLGLVLAIVPLSVAETKPGWGEWQPIAIDEEQTFSAGFSNLVLQP